MKIGRNDPCHCGSGEKYKKCCATKDEAVKVAQVALQHAALSALDTSAPPGVNAGTKSHRIDGPKKPKAPPPRPSVPRKRAV
jgi:hypothetical protein